MFLEPPAIIPFSFGDYPVNQGDSAQLMCAVTRGDRPLSITWSLKGDIINSDPTLTTTMIGQQTSLLIISSVDYQHSGTYTCRAENPAGVRTHTAELKVNGILTARHWEFSIYRITWNCSFLLWWEHCESRGICTTNVCHKKGRQTFINHMEFERRYHIIWSCVDNYNDRATDKSSEHLLSWLPAQWSIHMQSRESCRGHILLCRVTCQWYINRKALKYLIF